jgi:hypothetical protein
MAFWTIGTWCFEEIIWTLLFAHFLVWEELESSVAFKACIFKFICAFFTARVAFLTFITVYVIAFSA